MCFVFVLQHVIISTLHAKFANHSNIFSHSSCYIIHVPPIIIEPYPSNVCFVNDFMTLVEKAFIKCKQAIKLIVCSLRCVWDTWTKTWVLFTIIYFILFIMPSNTLLTQSRIVFWSYRADTYLNRMVNSAWLRSRMHSTSQKQMCLIKRQRNWRRITISKVAMVRATITTNMMMIRLRTMESRRWHHQHLHLRQLFLKWLWVENLFI